MLRVIPCTLGRRGSSKMNNRNFINESDIDFFQIQLLDWYNKNGRSFIWRNKTATNYELIISEILLQRTKAEIVTKFLPSFLKEYPSWKQLGNATEIELQEILRPLGLYRQRGSRLFKLAIELKKEKVDFQASVVRSKNYQ